MMETATRCSRWTARDEFRSAFTSPWSSKPMDSQGLSPVTGSGLDVHVRRLRQTRYPALQHLARRPRKLHHSRKHDNHAVHDLQCHFHNPCPDLGNCRNARRRLRRLRCVRSASSCGTRRPPRSITRRVRSERGATPLTLARHAPSGAENGADLDGIIETERDRTAPAKKLRRTGTRSRSSRPSTMAHRRPARPESFTTHRLSL
jgi:hypothetical protein